jgi:osmotically inducible protein OsmC
MKLVIRKASVRWVAGAHGGARVATTDSGALVGAHFSSGHLHRQNSDTNSAELLAAAHAGSFSLSLTEELGKAALGRGEIDISAAVTIEHLAAGWTIMNIHLNVVARLPRLSQGEFIDATVRAKRNCLVSRALRPTVSMNARLDKVVRGRADQTLCTSLRPRPLPKAGRRIKER